MKATKHLIKIEKVRKNGELTVIKYKNNTAGKNQTCQVIIIKMNYLMSSVKDSVLDSEKNTENWIVIIHQYCVYNN